jgi:hypothetical protein
MSLCSLWHVLVSILLRQVYICTLLSHNMHQYLFDMSIGIEQAFFLSEVEPIPMCCCP